MSQHFKFNLPKLYTSHFLSGFLFAAPILIPFFTAQGFSMQEILLIESGFFGALALFEVPSGFIADRYGRRFALILGSLLCFFGATLYSLSMSFWFFFGANCIWGIGNSLISGTNTALLYETLLKINKIDQYTSKQGLAIFYEQIGLFIASLTGPYLFLVMDRLPFYLTSLAFFVMFLVIVSIKEAPLNNQKEKFSGMTRLAESFRIFTKTKIIISVSLFSGILGFFMVSYYLWQEYFLLMEVPVQYFGFIISFGSLTIGLGAKFSASIVSRFYSIRSFFATTVFFTFLMWFLLGFYSHVFLLLFYIVLSFIWGLLDPLFRDLINKNIESRYRATVLSLQSAMQRGFFVIFSPLIGFLIDKYSLLAGFLGLAFLLLGLSIFCLPQIPVAVDN